MNVTIWNEYVSERSKPDAARIYPGGIHTALASVLSEIGSVRTATLEQPDHGLAQAVLESTDVLLWWAHVANDDVREDVVARVCERVFDGMGLIVLHSACASRPFMRLMGTRCTLRWREERDREVVWNVAPSHPITAGLSPAFVLAEHETYGEFFDVPPPEELIFISSFSGGEVFRSGCCWTRGKGRIFYFSPGHETFPVYHHPDVRRVLVNAARWAHVPAPSRVDSTLSAHAAQGWFESS